MTTIRLLSWLIAIGSLAITGLFWYYVNVWAALGYVVYFVICAITMAHGQVSRDLEVSRTIVYMDSPYRNPYTVGPNEQVFPPVSGMTTDQYSHIMHHYRAKYGENIEARQITQQKLQERLDERAPADEVTQELNDLWNKPAYGEDMSEPN